MGTVDYMAPEQGLSTKHADARADIYSLGCIVALLPHCSSARRPTLARPSIMPKSAGSSQPSHSQSPPILRDDVPDQVEAVFRKMVAKKIEDRYQTMTEVVADLEKCSGPLDDVGERSPSSVRKVPASGPVVRNVGVRCRTRSWPGHRPHRSVCRRGTAARSHAV